MRPKCARATLAAGIALACLCPASAPAQQEPAGGAAIAKPYFYFSAGTFDPDQNERMRDQSGQYSLNFGFGFRPSRLFAWEIAFFSNNQHFDTPASLSPPFFGTLSGRSTLGAAGVAGSAMLVYPAGTVEPYAGGGFGLYRPRLSTTATQLGIPYTLEQNSTDTGLHAVAGADFRLSERSSINIEFRKLWLDADFSVIGKVKAGGNSLLLGYRGRF